MAVIITIKRPDGKTEEVDMSNKFAGMNDILFSRIKKATAEAGKGECLSYRVDNTLTAEERAEVKAHDDKARWFEKHGFSGNDIN